MKKYPEFKLKISKVDMGHTVKVSCTGLMDGQILNHTEWVPVVAWNQMKPKDKARVVAVVIQHYLEEGEK